MNLKQYIDESNRLMGQVLNEEPEMGEEPKSPVSPVKKEEPKSPVSPVKKEEPEEEANDKTGSVPWAYTPAEANDKTGPVQDRVALEIASKGTSKTFEVQDPHWMRENAKKKMNRMYKEVMIKIEESKENDQMLIDEFQDFFAWMRGRLKQKWK